VQEDVPLPWLAGPWLGELGLCGLEKRQLCRDLTAALQYIKAAHEKDGAGLPTTVSRDRTRGSGSQLKESRFGLDIGEECSTLRVLRPWHRVPGEAVTAPSLAGFQGQVGRGWEQPGPVEGVPATAGVGLDGP